jgi:hypothetical protein
MEFVVGVTRAFLSMITYTEKGYGLQLAVTQAGHWLHRENGVWVSDNDVAVQAIINGYNPLPYAQQYAISQINAAVQAKLAKVVAAYPDLEISTWWRQVAEAEAFSANPAATTTTLSTIASISNQTVATLAASVLAKAAAYSVASGTPVGQRQLYTAQVMAATDWTLIAGITATALAAIGA